ncbi:hypothetical protein C8R45DRAFT_1098071 [Mycena sanguinolenta]|nr:hypothetical protein C8R45DRAFT_1098071 [Mycena sanguinolenta]
MQNNSQDHSLQWTHYNSQGRTDIKVESSADFSLLSPPSSPSLPSTNNSSRRRSSGSINSPKRVRPYPPHTRDTRLRIDDSEMAATPAFWPSSSNSRGNSSRATNDRRPSEGNPQLMYGSQYHDVSMSMYARPTESGEHRLSQSSKSSGSSGTSSLSGAMGDMSSRLSGSPPSRDDPLFSMTMGQPLEWNQAQMLASQSAYPGGMTSPAFMDPQGSSAYYRPSSESSLSPPSPFTTPSFNDPFRPTSAANYAPTATPAYPPVTPQEVEIRRLRKKVREMERLYEQACEQVKTLESRPGPHRTHSATATLPSPLSPQPTSASFQASWKARTDARVRQFCALNRAGNALCAWHDSRRERRVHPPRMAPHGYLNCGCTYEEALFEESLARHQVGSYLPGETVRMDPALRNPLLKLLQQRYGYRDGDFERDPRTGDWIPGEGPARWEQQIQAGAPRRERR